MFTYDSKRTQERLTQLKAYMEEHVLCKKELRCVSKKECEASHKHKCPGGKFYEGQMSHVGNCYDLACRGTPLRVVVVGQEYGHGPDHEPFDHRRAVILDCAAKTFGQRNPHLCGTTSLLRLLLLGKPPGTDREFEYVSFSDGTKAHLFDCFALVDYLLCSATNGKSRGMGTDTMKRNCRRHFRKTIEILEPNVIVVQGKGFWWPWVGQSFDSVSEQIAESLCRVRFGEHTALAAVFSHPSAPNKSNWGRSHDTDYLKKVVCPAVQRVRKMVLGE